MFSESRAFRYFVIRGVLKNDLLASLHFVKNKAPGAKGNCEFSSNWSPPLMMMYRTEVKIGTTSEEGISCTASRVIIFVNVMVKNQVKSGKMRMRSISHQKRQLKNEVAIVFNLGRS